jgi:3-oxoisoapionate decarboxylase
VKTTVTALAAGIFPVWAVPEAPMRSKMGIVTYSFGIHQKATRSARTGLDYNDPLGFLEACHQLGAGGIQFPFGLKDETYLVGLRQKAGQYEMHLEAILNLPKSSAELDRFEQELLCAKQCGATIARTTMLPGRRYEQFQTREAYERACEQGLKSLRLAEPVAARHKFRLAVENHKDHLVAEKLELLKQISSEYVGLCVDVINNFALLEDPLETARAFAPYAMTVHIKDGSIREAEDGFWLSDEALGAGFLDLPAIVGILRQAKPDGRFNLEVITRDPIKVPVLTDKYWATFPNRSRSAMDPALKLARERTTAQPQALVSRLPQARQLELERRNVEQSLKYARTHLGL